MSTHIHTESPNFLGHVSPPHLCLFDTNRARSATQCHVSSLGSSKDHKRHQRSEAIKRYYHSPCFGYLAFDDKAAARSSGLSGHQNLKRSPGEKSTST